MRPPRLRARRLATCQGQRREGRKRRVQKPPEPDAFTVAIFSDAVHAVVPVASADKRKPMPAHCQTRIQRKRAMFEESSGLWRNRGLKKTICLACFELRALEKRNQFVKHEYVFRRLDILSDSVCQPSPIVGDTGP